MTSKRNTVLRCSVVTEDSKRYKECEFEGDEEGFFRVYIGNILKIILSPKS